MAPTVWAPQCAQVMAYCQPSITTGANDGSSVTWLRPTRRPPVSGSGSPHPSHARGRHSTTTSGSLRTRLTPTCPRLGPAFRPRRSTRFAFWPRDGGTDELSGVFAGRRNCDSSSSSSRIFSSRRSIAASRAASSSC